MLFSIETLGNPTPTIIAPISLSPGKSIPSENIPPTTVNPTIFVFKENCSKYSFFFSSDKFSS